MTPGTYESISEGEPKTAWCHPQLLSVSTGKTASGSHKNLWMQKCPQETLFGLQVTANRHPRGLTVLCHALLQQRSAAPRDGRPTHIPFHLSPFGKNITLEHDDSPWLVIYILCFSKTS